MKSRSVVLMVLWCLLAFAVSWAQDPNMGTWKLNESKSKIPAGAPKNTTVVYSADGDNVKVTTDGTVGNGTPQHTEWTGKFDGKDYPLTGDPNADARSYKKIDAHTLALENKKGGKVVVSGKVMISPDGKSRTVNLAITTPAGKKISSSAVYDKQ